MAPVDRYSKAQIWLHWIIVVLVALQLALHEGMSRVWDRALETGAFDLALPAVLHFTFGAVILGLTMWRFAIRQERGVPQPPDSEPPNLQKIGHFAHLAFYGLLILLPVTGGLAWGAESEALAEIHEVLRTVLVILIVAHIAAVIYHQRVLKSGVLQRMLASGDKGG